ncbi:glycosyltransferase family 4 protein [Eisenbergiella sp.]
MKKVLMTTNHPAPYMDKWFIAIKNKYELSVIYNHEKDAEKTWRDYSGFPGMYYDKLSWLDLWKLIGNQDLLIVGGWTNRYCMQTILMGKLRRKKVGVFTDYPFHQNKYADIFKRLFLYRIIDIVFCATRSTEILLQAKYALKPSQTSFFPYAAELENVEMQNIDLSEKVRILIANNFIERKGYDVLFKALEILNKKSCNYRDYEFHIAGHGPLLDEYKKRAKDLELNIIFYGWCEPEKYSELQNNTSVYIHASLEEPFGIPPLDAMARGKIVIVSDGVKSVDGLIVDGVNGFIYSSKDYSALADHIAKLRNFSASNIGMCARNDVMRTYSVKRNLEAIDQCLEGE